MSSVLVTGASGFIGRHVIPGLLARGLEVHALYHPDPIPAEARDGLHWHRFDIFDYPSQKELLRTVKPDILLHLAWYAVPGQYVTSPENLRWVQASLELAMNFAAVGGTRIVAAGTCFEYDLTAGLCSEDTTPLLPGTLYGACKASLFRILERFCLQAGIAFAWGRVFYLFGPHEYPDRLVSSVIRSLLRHRKALCTQGEQIRDFLPVTAVADAFAHLAASPYVGPANIGSGRGMAVRELVTMIGDKIGRMDLIEFGAMPSDPNDPPSIIADTRTTSKKVGWESHFPIESEIDRTIAWWREKIT